MADEYGPAGYEQLLRQGLARDRLKRQSEGGGEFLGILGKSMAVDPLAGWHGLVTTAGAKRRGASWQDALAAGAQGVEGVREHYAPQDISPAAGAKLDRLSRDVGQVEDAANAAGWYDLSAHNPGLAAVTLAGANLIGGPKRLKPGELPKPHAPHVPEPRAATWAETIADAQQRMDAARDSGNRPSYDAWDRVRQNAISEQMREGATPAASAPASETRRPQSVADLTRMTDEGWTQGMNGDWTPAQANRGIPGSTTHRQWVRMFVDDHMRMPPERRAQHLADAWGGLTGEEGSTLLSAIDAAEPAASADAALARRAAAEGGGESDLTHRLVAEPMYPGAPDPRQTQLAQALRNDEGPPMNRRTGQMTLPGVEHVDTPVPLGEQRKATEFGAPGYDEARARASAEAFFTGAKDNENLFLYGTEPPPRMRDMEDLARHYSEKSGERIRVDEQPGEESDEPYKIKEKKEHGRGEVMRDRWGDYKTDEFEGGEKKYDDRGNLITKTIDKELTGPPDADYFARADLRQGPSLWGEKEVPKLAEAGQMMTDDEGNPVYRKSEGGEPVRDERGRVKYEERENPDYSPPSDEFKLSVPSKHSSITFNPEDGSIYAGSSKAGTGAGQLLYQLANSYAVRNGIDIGGTNLTAINQLRMLGNALSTYVRHGENPRDVSGAAHGARPKARGQAGGFEMLNAETGEAEARLRAAGVDPRRIEFDGHDFLIDGEPATAKEITAQLNELSPKWKHEGSQGGVGTKTLMRSALMRWLESATPEVAEDTARMWSKKLGPLFAGVAGLSPLSRALRGQEEEQTQ